MAAASASATEPLLQKQQPQKQQPLDSHWKWYAVDVKKKSPTLALELAKEDVRLIRKGLRGGPVLLSPPPPGQVRYEVRTVKMREMQTEAPPGWWGDDAKGSYAQTFTEEDVVVQQTIEPNPQGKKPWRLIVRVPAGSALDRQLLNTDRWTTDVLITFSGPEALLDVGASIGNDDLPVRFTGAGFVPDDFLVHTTPYEKFSCDGFSTIPESVFEVDEETKKMHKLCRSDGLLEDFFFNDNGVVLTLDPGEGSYYYARIVGKAWWHKTLCFALLWALLVAVDQYNNLTFFWSTREMTLMSWAFLVAVLLFACLECYFSWLLACLDMEEKIHKDDMAMAEESVDAKYYFFQSMLHFLQVPTAVKDIVIWTCPRGATMGRAVAKAAGARVHVLTWPSRYHYQCDLVQGQHKMYPLLLLKNVVLLSLQSVIIHLSDSGPVWFWPYLLPKILIVVLTGWFFGSIVVKRDRLRRWLVGKWTEEEQPGRQRLEMPLKPPEDKKKTALFGVYKKHFYDAPRRELLNYPHFNPEVLVPVSEQNRLPLYAVLGVICMVTLAIGVAWLEESVGIFDFER